MELFARLPGGQPGPPNAGTRLMLPRCFVRAQPMAGRWARLQSRMHAGGRSPCWSRWTCCVGLMRLQRRPDREGRDHCWARRGCSGMACEPRARARHHNQGHIHVKQPQRTEQLPLPYTPIGLQKTRRSNHIHNE
jgi:hypothetical protein